MVNLHFLISTNESGSELMFNVFHRQHEREVMDSIIRGQKNAKSLDIVVPLITREGTMSFGNRKMNAGSLYQQTSAGKLKKISSFEYLMQHMNEEGNLDNVLRGFMYAHYGGTDTERIDILNQRMEKMVSGAFDELSGATNRGGVNDSSFVRGQKKALSDFFKQTLVDVRQGMIHDFYYNYPIKEEFGLSLTEKDFKDSAFVKRDEAFVVNKDGRRILRENVSMDDLQQDAQQRLLINQDQWFQRAVKDKGLVPDAGLHYSSAKSTDVQHGRLSVLPMQYFYSFGEYSGHLKDNQVQALNRYHIDAQQMEDLGKIKGVHTGTMMTNALREDLTGRLGYAMDEVQVKGAMMSQTQVNERISQMMKTDEGISILSERQNGILMQMDRSAVEKMKSAGLLSGEMKKEIIYTDVEMQKLINDNKQQKENPNHWLGIS
jgi:hypothetical protein